MCAPRSPTKKAWTATAATARAPAELPPTMLAAYTTAISTLVRVRSCVVRRPRGAPPSWIPGTGIPVLARLDGVLPAGLWAALQRGRISKINTHLLKPTFLSHAIHPHSPCSHPFVRPRRSAHAATEASSASREIRHFTAESLYSTR